MHRSLLPGFLASLAPGMLLVACASSNNDALPPGTATARIGQQRDAGPSTFDSGLLVKQGIHVEQIGDTVVYRGRLTDNGLDALRNVGNDPAIRTLLIDSTGGDFVTGMNFGNWVVGRELDVTVDRICLSSCANYIFPAAGKKNILPGAVVAWNGSAKQAGLLDRLDQTAEAEIATRALTPGQKRAAVKLAHQANLEYLTRTIREQDEFFYRIGVDEYVTRIGNDKYGVQGFFYLSVADMAEFGIENVSAADDYDAMDPEALAKRLGRPVTLVRIE